MHETYEEKQVIEPEVIESLPSVRKLAEIYKKNDSPSEVQLVKPKVIKSVFLLCYAIASAMLIKKLSTKKLSILIMHLMNDSCRKSSLFQCTTEFLSIFSFAYFFYRNQRIILRKVLSV